MATSAWGDAPHPRRVSTARALVLATGVFVALLGITCVAEASPARRALTQAPGFYRMELGDFEITVLSDGTLPQPVEELMTNTTREQLGKLLARAYRESPLEASINAFLVNTGQKLVLIDTGVGDLLGPGQGGELLNSLRAAGVRAKDIDMVLLTHLHPDHIGGLVREGKIIFGDATLHVDANEVAFWLDPRNRANAPEPLKPRFDEAVAMIEPYRQAGRLRPFARPTELAPGVRTVIAYGHTPGHSVFEVESRGARIAFWGDVVHFAPIQLPEPSITIAYDIDPGAAAKRRIDALTQAAKQRTLVALSHFSFPGLGQIRQDGRSFTWLPVDYERRLGVAK
ncbi:MAG: MBL fold metallo-hydrolase [Polyangiales bacterium]